MGANKKRGAQTSLYPQNAAEWREAASRALNLTQEEGRARLNAGTFPFDDFTAWIRKEFSSDKGYSPSFIPALLRNRKGLISWVYGDGSEPDWSGQDTCSSQS